MTFPGMLTLIERKKHGEALDDALIQGWIHGIVADEIPNYQSAALLMAIRLKGMTFEETLALTRAMADSGKRLEFSGYPILADKHSTGGVGDKVTLVLAPLVAAVGLPVTMLSGRALGFSGGTIDKFEALQGVSCDLAEGGMQAMLDEIGWANAPASRDIAPADRILYALRDVTGTVDSIPLITASILAKKLSGGATHLCLDVKAGSGAFMTDLASAKALAENLQKIGEMGGLSTTGLVSRMEEPLGHAVGNYLELMESISYLRQPPNTPLMILIERLAERMLLQCGVVTSPEQARVLLRRNLENGKALEKLVAYLRFTGAEEQALQDLLNADFTDFPRYALRASRGGYVQHINGRTLGEIGVQLGAGRSRADERIDPLAGFLIEAHVGDPVEKGGVLAWVYGEKGQSLTEGRERRLLDAFVIEEQPFDVPEQILHQF